MKDLREVTDDMVTAFMREFEKWTPLLRYKEVEKWHVNDIMGVRYALRAALLAHSVPEGEAVIISKEEAEVIGKIRPDKRTPKQKSDLWAFLAEGERDALWQHLLATPAPVRESDDAAKPSPTREGDRGMGEWQPISTAPDEKYVLVFCPEGQAVAIQMVPGCWYVWGAGPHSQSINPTHWRPLLPPPSKTED